MNKNENAWKKLFEKYHILEEIDKNGSFVITADQIKEFREPRLMTKFDHKNNLPKIFSENNLSILPLTRGDYIISSFCAYKEFEEISTESERVSLPANIQSLTPNFIISEAIALNYANASGILKDFLEDDNLVATVSGRMSSEKFNFNIDTATGMRELEVNNSQIEIDAAYEGVKYLSLFEAKKHLADDFLVRQLYYPFRVWKERVSKDVKLVFLIFSNGVFHLYQYQFDDPMSYNSLRLVKQKSYVISKEISLFDIEELLRTTKISQEPNNIAFPQANNMARIVNLIELLTEKPMTKQDITATYDFDERQTNYYTDAGRYLGLIEKHKNEKGEILFSLSTLGKNIMSRDYRERNLLMTAQILKHNAFYETLKIHLESGDMPSLDKIVGIMKSSQLHNVVADSTYYRRSSTITGWINWILKLIEE